ncbi:MAG: activator of Hsp90 ATPase 1 family protein [Paenibacillus sp.]|jgi:uncharacterized protein YndB with AHSA1/START domain|nr:activator of Hsp90 ATPase 1 family protein [Paenibacillus sp.]
MSEEKATKHDSQLVITRIFDAPRELVFKTWTESEHLKQWWGPIGFSISVSKFDIRPGGVFHYCMKSSEGHEMWGKFVYREIVAPEMLVFVNSFSDAEGNIVRAPFHESVPLKIQNSLTLTEHEGKTILTLRVEPIDATEEELQFFYSIHGSMQEGYGGTFSKLDDYLAKL